MSPEQARGLAVDKRADTWAFGCVLYEMLTGHVAFPGDTVSDIIVSVLDREPAWAALPAATPRRRSGCFAAVWKRTCGAVCATSATRGSTLEESMTPATAPASSVGLVRPRREIVFQRLTDFTGMKESPAVSPDGKMVAFVALVGGKRQICVRFLAGGADAPAHSRRGRSRATSVDTRVEHAHLLHTCRETWRTRHAVGNQRPRRMAPAAGRGDGRG